MRERKSYLVIYILFNTVLIYNKPLIAFILINIFNFKSKSLLILLAYLISTYFLGSIDVVFELLPWIEKWLNISNALSLFIIYWMYFNLAKQSSGSIKFYNFTFRPFYFTKFISSLLAFIFNLLMMSYSLSP